MHVFMVAEIHVVPIDPTGFRRVRQMRDGKRPGMWQTQAAMTPRADPSTLRVVWTRGRGCRELAALLAGGGEPSRVQGDPAADCVAQRADLLVSRRIQPSFDLVDVAVPVDLDPSSVEAVVAAVGGGPHSLLAARVASRLGQALDVPASMVAAYPVGGDGAAADDVIRQISPAVPDIAYRTVATSGMTDLVASLLDKSLLVFGAPGGSWLQRRVSGAGAKLRSRADAGAVIVKAAPRRVFQHMAEPLPVAPMMRAQDTLHLRSESTLAVADEGRLVGIVRRSRLAELPPDAPVEKAMEEPVSLLDTDPLEAAMPLLPLFGSDPIPVVSSNDRLVGSLVMSPA